jgi:hypothetical protein
LTFTKAEVVEPYLGKAGHQKGWSTNGLGKKGQSREGSEGGKCRVIFGTQL